MKNQAFYYTAIAAIIWGATAPVMKLTLLEIPVFSLAFLRMTIASAILAPLIWQKLKVKKADRITFVWAAITGVSLNLSLFFFGLKLTEAILAAFLVAAVPIFTMLAAHIYLRESFTSNFLLASTLAFAGVAIIIGKPDGQINSNQIWGNLLLLASTISWVAHEIIAKKLLRSYDGGTVAFWSMAIGAVTFLPFALWEFWQNPNWTNNVSMSGFGGLLFGIFFSSLAAYWAWQKGLSLLPAGKAAFFFYLDPISGALLAMLLLGEKLTLSLVLGGIFIVAGVILAEQKRRNHPLHRALHQKPY